MTDTTDIAPAETSGAGTSAPKAAAKKKGGGLNTLLLADLKSMAGGLGISGAGSMKKAQLVEAIKAVQSGGQSGGASTKPAAEEKPVREDRPSRELGRRADRIVREQLGADVGRERA